MDIARSSLYYERKGESPMNLQLMQEIDRIFIDYPTTGAKKMTARLRRLGYEVNVKRVRRLMRKMNLVPIYPRKCLSVGGNTKYVYPYLLRGLEITHPNQVWSTDISYIPMNGGFMYMYAVIDVYSRYIVGWRLSNTLSALNVFEMVETCIADHGAPEIINTDQGVQYTSKGWADLLNKYDIQISMDGRGRCKDNIWIERFWRTLKQDHIYIHPADSVTELRSGITGYLDYYNNERPHETLGKATCPNECYKISA
jgi:putative transposase